MSDPEQRSAIPRVERPRVDVDDGSSLPVRRIWCVGRNYADHAREMGGDPEREPPFFFAKPADAIVPDGAVIAFPRATGELHHEVELAVAIGCHGSDLSPEEARRAIFGYAVALDMTRRDLQDAAKATRRPWDVAKGFDRSCPIGVIRRASVIGHPMDGALELFVNGRVRQSGDLRDMIWSASECVAALSSLVDIAPGDILLTGTPAGVGRVLPGDELVARCHGVGTLAVRYAPSGPPSREEPT